MYIKPKIIALIVIKYYPLRYNSLYNNTELNICSYLLIQNFGKSSSDVAIRAVRARDTMLSIRLALDASDLQLKTLNLKHSYSLSLMQFGHLCLLSGEHNILISFTDIQFLAT